MESLAALVAVIVLVTAGIGLSGGVVAGVLAADKLWAEVGAVSLLSFGVGCLLTAAFSPAVTIWYIGGWVFSFALTYFWRRA